MKNKFSRVLSVFLAVLMLFSSFPIVFSAQATGSASLSLARQTVIEEMKKMAIAKWTPKETYTTYHYYAYGSGGGEKMTWTKGKTYYGIPYSQNPTIYNDINHKYNVTYDVFAGSLSKDGTLSRDLGRNDCSSSVVMALQTVDKKIKLTFTSQMRPGVNNLVAVGSYTYYGNKKTTCQNNGASTMYACYSKLKPGDLLVQDGHAMMVVDVDKTNKYVTIVHQTGLSKHYIPETDTSRNANGYSDKNSTWGVNDKFSFYFIWYNGYIPLASKTLVEDDKNKQEQTMCGQVKNVTSTQATSNSVTLSWDKNKKATGYIIYKFANGQFEEIGRTKKTTYTAEGLYSAKDYRFAVKSYLKYDKKVYTNIFFTIATAATTPKKVTGVTAQLNKKGTKATISWNEVNRAEVYYIYQSVGTGGKYKYIGSSQTTSFKVENLEKDKKYYYKVRAVIKRNGSKLKGDASKAAKAIYSKV